MIKAIVTGHSRGLGAAVAAELVARGIPVLGLARGHAEIGEGMQQAVVDLGDAAALAAWLGGHTLRSFLAGCDTALLVNNAGVVTPVGPLAEQDPVAALQSAVLNVAAPLALSAAFVQAAPHAERRILHISSGAGRSAYPGWSVYCASKAALDQHARAVALDADPRVKACSLAPGVIDTDMQAEIRATPDTRFPLRQRFVDMKDSGVLVAPAACAVALVDYLLAKRFGSEPVDDLRN
ncbi:SDR family oxidoreductase [Massilia yuzhufengensis]|uniref:Short-chain dehydrogenase n=1 Tax=Massilia yuzhufengensis TaxID=1164594 RepID=A0A1I1K4Q0_9BURK|nr:SDR family oxidoreductase [Massilia yuzhufengensis]SFC55585.1 Short-chain dehydrogenase [Massilia yuzhufengensis]